MRIMEKLKLLLLLLNHRPLSDIKKVWLLYNLLIRYEGM
jgi:hypothetical protein